MRISIAKLHEDDYIIFMKHTLHLLFISIAALSVMAFAALAAHAKSGVDNADGKAPIYTSWKNNLGAGGYDVVSYFSGEPVKGDSDFVADYKGAQWQFSNQANLDLFQTNPEAFAPQFGGYCSWAIAQGKLAKGRPEHWSLEDGKLYLNYNKRIKTLWDADKDSLIAQGNENYPSILTD